MAPKNALYAQSGGVTSVINATARGVIETARQNPDFFNNVYAGHNGILGILEEDMFDTYAESAEAIAGLSSLPGGAFGSCRFKLKSSEPTEPTNQRLLEIFSAHNIGYFFYNGGGDSQDTVNKVSKLCQAVDFPMQCIGIPKTIDNDLAGTDFCPGFPSVAKYIAISTLEASLDVESMAASSTKVFILECMGRHAGWIAAAAGLAGSGPDECPHVILFPEVAFDADDFLAKVKSTVERLGVCVVVASEGIKDTSGTYVAEAGSTDAFGHTQLGGVGSYLAGLVKDRLNLKYHYALADYLQRAARHISSQVDVDEAYAVGQSAVESAINGHTDVMVTLQRSSEDPPTWRPELRNLSEVANIERKLPGIFIRRDGYGITEACRQYLSPLIAGEAYPAYTNGLPSYRRLARIPVRKLLATMP